MLPTRWTADEILTAMVDESFSQVELAKWLDVSRACVSLWVGGQTTPNETNQEALDQLFGPGYDPASLEAGETGR